MKKSTLLLLFLPSLGWGQPLQGDTVEFKRTRYEVQADGNLNLVRGDNVNHIYQESLWFSGYSYGTDTIHHNSVQTYRQDRASFFPGPISSDTASYSYWNRTWTVTSGMVDSLKNGLYFAIPEPLLNWPAHGRAQFSESQELAPFVDVNNNGVYEPQSGDYPIIKGDVCTIAVFNDWQYRGFFQYWSFVMEGIVYYYMIDGDDIEDRTIFTEFEIVNKSNKTYYDTWMGVFADIDVGYASMNLSGTDIARHAVYSYPKNSMANGVNFPGESPWASVVILEGPAADPFDGRDNNWDGCVDGVADQFGNCISEDPSNGIVEPITMMRSMSFTNTSGQHNSNPLLDAHFGNYLRGLWRDGTHILIENPDGFGSVFNGDGHNPSAAMGISHYIFPGNSSSPDLLSLPSNPVNFFESPDKAEDQRVVASMGAFTWAPNEKITLKYASIWGKEDTSAFDNILDSIGADIDELFLAYNTIGQSENSARTQQLVVGQDLQYLYVENPHDEAFELEVMDLTGRTVATGHVGAFAQTQLPISGLPPGVYVLRTPESNFSIKWMKRP
ncbi:MAG: T9SS type A sorting domain-containing protein [Flavobacteriia bacterium]|nr:T9SS type A sorting domain-containing protein [Flavobacteriia bacterium]